MALVVGVLFTREIPQFISQAMQHCLSRKLSLCVRAFGSFGLSHPLKGSQGAFVPSKYQGKGVWKSTHIAMGSKQELQSLPGVTTNVDPATKDFIFQQTMYRIKDPKVSLDFYTRILGMTLLGKFDFPTMKFSLYFVGYEPLESVPEDEKERAVWLLRKRACIELTHNYGTESDPEFKGYHDGNAEPQGFGHIGLSVPNVDEACKRFKELGVQFVKKPEDGKMKGIAFIKDPDGYWIEILNAEATGKLVVSGEF